MRKLEFQITLIIIAFCYLSVIFQVNYKNTALAEKGKPNYTFNAFSGVTLP